MKKLLFSIIVVLFMVCLVPCAVHAEVDQNIAEDESNLTTPKDEEQTPDEIIKDSTIIKFDFYPGGSLSNVRELTFEWISIEKMENLVVRLFNPKTNSYIDIFDINKDLEIEEDDESIDSGSLEGSESIEEPENKFDGEFEIIDEPLDDPLTPDVDETKDKFWKYKLTFKLAKDTYGLLKFAFVYDCGETSYENLFYLPNVVYPSVVVPPTPPSTDDNKDDDSNKDDNDGYFTTSNALIAAIFATVCSVIGTLLIIFSSQYRKFDDEEFK